MARLKSRHVCSACGHEEAKWLGRCPACGAWNTLEEQEAQDARPKLRSAPALSATDGPWLTTCTATCASTAVYSASLKTTCAARSVNFAV